MRGVALVVAVVVLTAIAVAIAWIGVACVVHGLRQFARVRRLAQAPRRTVRVLRVHRDRGPRRPVYLIPWEDGEAEIEGPLPGAPERGATIEVAVEDGAPVVPAVIARDAGRLLIGGLGLGALPIAGAVAWLLRLIAWGAT